MKNHQNNNIEININRFVVSIMVIGVCLLGFNPLQAQSSDALDLEKAIAIALKQNNNVQIARNNTEIARQQNTLGNAGYLPTISATGNTNFGINNSTFQIVGQPETKINGAQSLTYSSGLSLNYTIFGGLGAFYSRKNLNLSEQNASIQERLNIEGIILRTIQSYCQVLQMQNNYDLSVSSMEISKQRIERAQTRFKLAGATKLELLNAEVDYNTDSTNLIRSETALANAKLQLVQLLNMNQVELKNVEILPLKKSEEIMNEASLKEMALKNNSSVLNAYYNSDISEAQMKLTRAPMLPRLSLQSSYNFNRTENDGSFIPINQSVGFSGSIQLSIPIFDGHKKSIQYQNAEVRVRNAELNWKESVSTMERDISLAFSNHDQAKRIASLDEKTVETATLNFNRTKELFDNGQVSGLQFREAQLNLVRVQAQAANNQINVKLTEVELMRLSGQLIQ